jgi:fibronectin type 3 domain-containing protein
LYSASAGYGWSSVVGLSSRDRGAPDDLKRDLVQSTTEHTFSFDLANGNYQVIVTIGDQSYMHDNIDVYAEDILEINDLTIAAASFQEVIFDVTVADEQLNLRLLDDEGADANWVLNAVAVQSV